MLRISGRARPEVGWGKHLSSASYLHVPARSPTFLIGEHLLAANPPAVMCQTLLSARLGHPWICDLHPSTQSA